VTISGRQLDDIAIGKISGLAAALAAKSAAGHTHAIADIAGLQAALDGAGGGAVASVFGRTGAVVAAPDDYAVDDIAGLTDVLQTKVDAADARLADARAPTSHATSHTSAGADPLTLAQSQVAGLVSDLAAKADAASLSAVATSGAYADLVGRPALGSAAAEAVTAFDAAGSAAAAQAASLGLHATADAAATLATPRAINGVNFDGTAAITISVAGAAGGALTGSYPNPTLSSSVGGSGTAQIDFGAGGSTAEVVITDVASTLAGSRVMASLRMQATTDHTVDDLLIDPVKVAVKDIVACVGFTIHGAAGNAPAYGLYCVDWFIFNF